MRRIGMISTAVLSLSLAAAVPMYAQQEQHDQQEEKKDKPVQPKEKREKEKPEKQKQEKEKPAQTQQAAKPAKKNAREEKTTRTEERNVREPARENKPTQHAHGGRIPDDRYRANFGREHRFRVNEGDYRNHHFQYGGYHFEFVDAWPNNWLYTQDVFVIEIDGVYYLCNESYPGVNVTLNVIL